MMKYVFHLLLLLSINYSFAQQQVDSTIIDSFDNNINQWGESETAESTGKISGGKYYVNHLRAEGSWGYFQSFPVNLNENFSIEASLDQT